MKKLFKNSLIALLLVGLTAGCRTQVDSKETTPENSKSQVVASENDVNASNTKSITLKVTLKENTTKESTTKKTSKVSSEIKETDVKEMQAKETTKASKTEVKQTEAKQTEVKQNEAKQATKEVKLKSIEEVAQDVLNGKYGNGEQRRARLKKEGYNYNEVQTAVEKLIPTPTQPRQTQAQQSSTTQQSQTQYNYAPLSLVINGEYFTMNTPYGPGEDPQTPVLQAILDRYNKE